MKIGFVGAGAMGGAILNGAVKAGVLEPAQIYVYDKLENIRNKYSELGCTITADNEELAAKSDLIVLAVKPQQAAEAMSELKKAAAGKAVLSIMAGKTVSQIRQGIDGDVRLMRIMPNTPALVNAGAFACDAGTDFTEEEKSFAQQMLESIGIVEWMPENLINTACGLSGAGPAYVALFIEALADGGVLKGLPRATAIRLAEQTVMGTAKMIMETGMHPGAVKDMVSSPGGNTIVGIRTMEEFGVRGAMINTVGRSVERSEELANV